MVGTRGTCYATQERRSIQIRANDLSADTVTAGLCRAQEGLGWIFPQRCHAAD